MLGRHGVNQIQDAAHAHGMADSDAKFPTFVVVPLVGNARFANTVGEHALDEEAINHRRVVFERVDSASDHPQRGSGNLPGDQPHALPGIFLELAHGLFQM